MGRPTRSTCQKRKTNDDPDQRPLKKRNGVTAGVAQHSEPGPAYGGGGRNDGNLVS